MGILWIAVVIDDKAIRMLSNYDGQCSEICEVKTDCMSHSWNGK